MDNKFQKELEELLNKDIADYPPAQFKSWTLKVQVLGVLANEPASDFIIYDLDLSLRSPRLYNPDYLNKLSLNGGNYLGQVRAGGGSNWENLHASVLPVGTKIYRYPGWKSKIVAVTSDGERIVYNRNFHDLSEYDGEMGQLIYQDTSEFTETEKEQRLRNINALLLLHKKHKSSDFFVTKHSVCVKTDEVADSCRISDDNITGTIKRTGEQEEWQEWDATLLKPGTPIYKIGNKFAAPQNNVYIVYENNIQR